MPKLTATVIVYNAEREIEGCLRRLQWVDEIIVVDDGSTDRSAALARQFTPSVFRNPGEGQTDARNHAAGLATGDWVLHMDADEWVTDELAAEIRRTIDSPTAADGYYIPRRTFWVGHWIKHGGWYPDYVLRLFRKGRAVSEGHVHDHVVVSGLAGRLVNDLVHYSYRSVQAHVERMVLRFANREVRQAIANNVRIYLIFPWGPFLVFAGRFLSGPKSWLAFRMLYKELIRNKVEIAWLIPFMPLVRFMYRYVFQLGFLDGVPGFWIAALSGCYEAIRYAKLWEYFYRRGLADLTGLDPREVWDQGSLKV